MVSTLWMHRNGTSILLLGMPVICEYAITYFAKTRISHIFRMTFSKLHNAKIMLHMLHMQQFAYICIYAAYVIKFFSIFLVKRCLKTVRYFWRQTITGVFTIRC